MTKSDKVSLNLVRSSDGYVLQYAELVDLVVAMLQAVGVPSRGCRHRGERPHRGRCAGG